MLERAGRLNLLGPLGVHFAPANGEGGGAFTLLLLDSFRRRCVLSWDLPRASSALSWWEPFLIASGRRPPFRPALDLEGQIYNRLTLDLFYEFMMRSPPLGKAKGDHISSDAGASYVSIIHLIRSREARYDIAPSNVDFNARLAAKTVRRGEDPRGTRKLSRGLRAEHMRAAVAAGFDIGSTAQAAIDWAAILTAHNLLLRGGEVGVPDGIEPDARRILTFAKFEWRPARHESRRRLWLIVYVVPIKDAQVRRRGYPCPVARRHDGPLGADPLCTYDALAIAYWLRRGGARATFPVDRSGRPAEGWWLQARRREGAADDDAPFFTLSGGFMYSTADFRTLVRRVAAAAGLNPEEFGAKGGRVGGATDWQCSLGHGAAQAIIKRRGRWDSDAHQVYQRPLVEEQLSASAAIGDASGAGLEDICAGFAEAAA